MARWLSCVCLCVLVSQVFAWCSLLRDLRVTDTAATTAVLHRRSLSTASPDDDLEADGYGLWVVEKPQATSPRH